MQNRMALQHCSGRQAAAEQLGVRPLDQVRIQPGQRNSAEDAFDSMQAQFVSVVGPRSDPAASDCQPFLYVRAQLQSLGPHRDSAVEPPTLLAQSDDQISLAARVDVLACSARQPKLAFPAAIRAQLDCPAPVSPSCHLVLAPPVAGDCKT